MDKIGYRELFEKVESLAKAGVNNGLIEACDLSELKSQIKRLRTAQDLQDFKNNGFHDELIELTSLCGRVCCAVVVKPNSPLQEYACSSCPIFKYEESIVD